MAYVDVANAVVARKNVAAAVIKSAMAPAAIQTRAVNSFSV
ncbi:MAG: hypothetical protein K0R24_45 [Gammaproteobacteria bacterium]|nr:hypothetical protein [Gammaproteobacteria bacterium]